MQGHARLGLMTERESEGDKVSFLNGQYPLKTMNDSNHPGSSYFFYLSSFSLSITNS